MTAGARANDAGAWPPAGNESEQPDTPSEIAPRGPGVAERTCADRPPTLAGTVALGCAGAAAMAIGGTLAGGGDVAGTTRGWLWDVPVIPVRPAVDLLPALASFYVGLVLLTKAWIQLRRRVTTGALIAPGQPRSATGVIVAVFALWAIPLLLGPPLGSRDVYSYVAIGELAATGEDPYEVGPGALDDAALVAAVDPNWRSTPTPYGPAFLGLARLADRAGDRLGLLGSIYAFRVVVLAALALVVAHLPRLARAHGGDPTLALVLVLCNPLTLLHLVSGANNDAVMVGLLVAGLSVATLGWRDEPSNAPLGPAGSRASTAAFAAGVVLVTFAAAVKAPALLGVVWLAWQRPSPAAGVAERLRVMAAGGGLALVTLAALAQVTGFGWGWIAASQAVGSVAAYLSPATLVATGVAGLGHLAGLTPDLAGITAAVQFVAVAAAGIVVLALLGRSRGLGLQALGAAFLVVALLLPAVHPWYVAWGVVLLATVARPTPSRVLVGVSVVMSFAVLPGGPNLGSLLLDEVPMWSLPFAVLALVPLTFRWVHHGERLRAWAVARRALAAN